MFCEMSAMVLTVLLICLNDFMDLCDSLMRTERES